MENASKGLFLSVSFFSTLLLSEHCLGMGRDDSFVPKEDIYTILPKPAPKEGHYTILPKPESPTSPRLKKSSNIETQKLLLTFNPKHASQLPPAKKEAVKSEIRSVPEQSHSTILRKSVSEETPKSPLKVSFLLPDDPIEEKDAGNFLQKGMKIFTSILSKKPDVSAAQGPVETQKVISHPEKKGAFNSEKRKLHHSLPTTKNLLHVEKKEAPNQWANAFVGKGPRNNFRLSRCAYAPLEQGATETSEVTPPAMVKETVNPEMATEERVQYAFVKAEPKLWQAPDVPPAVEVKKSVDTTVPTTDRRELPLQPDTFLRRWPESWRKQNVVLPVEKKIVSLKELVKEEKEVQKFSPTWPSSWDIPPDALPFEEEKGVVSEKNPEPFKKEIEHSRKISNPAELKVELQESLPNTDSKRGSLSPVIEKRGLIKALSEETPKSPQLGRLETRLRAMTISVQTNPYKPPQNEAERSNPLQEETNVSPAEESH